MGRDGDRRKALRDLIKQVLGKIQIAYSEGVA
jgi:hypothetical protein